jgi:hypothetical protein
MKGLTVPEDSEISPASRTRHTICTLFEGDYHHGVAALVNSLARAGYEGTVWIGYRGSLPVWVNQLKSLNVPGEYLVADKIRLAFVLLNTKIHFANYKPQFMLDLLANQANDADHMWYFDPDICLRCSWSFFETWSRFGIAICQDAINNILPANDPLTLQWIEIGINAGLGRPRPLLHYFNSGMVGVSVANKSFLELWQRMIELAIAGGSNTHKFSTGNRERPFFMLDQDAMNIAAMCTEHPLTTMGPDAMGFIPGGYTMYHVMGPKPWRGSMTRRALDGRKPSLASKFYLTHTTSPIRIYSPLQLRLKKLDCSVATAIGRFYHR